MNQDEIAKLYFDNFSGEDDVFDEDWAINYAESNLEELDIVYSGNTDSNNSASGDESEVIYEHRADESLTFHFAANSTGGIRGPFLTYNECVKALGYNPEHFDCEYGPFDPKAVRPDAKCPCCGAVHTVASTDFDSDICVDSFDEHEFCEHYIITFYDDASSPDGILDRMTMGNNQEGILDYKRITTWATWIEDALTKGKNIGVELIAIKSVSSLSSLSKKSKTNKREKPYSVRSEDCNELIRDLLVKSGALISKRYFFNGRVGPLHIMDFYSKNPVHLIEQCEQLLHSWLELPTGNKK